MMITLAEPMTLFVASVKSTESVGPLVMAADAVTNTANVAEAPGANVAVAAAIGVAIHWPFGVV